MRQSVRAMLRRTRVVTASGLRIGWLCDIELDLDTGHLSRIGTTRFRFLSRPKHWIHKNDIIRWEPQRIIVNDAWAETRSTKTVRRGAPSPASAASCFYDKRS